MNTATTYGLEDVSKMPPEYKELLIRQLLAHTEGELSGGDTYIRMAPYAPNAYELKVIYESAAEEINHYMIGAKLLADLGVDVKFMLHQDLSERKYYPSDFVHEYDNWAERGLASMLAESAALEHILEMRESSYRPLAESCDVVITEESKHIAHGVRIIRGLCETDEGRAKVQRVLDWKWGQVLDLFGSSSSERSARYIKWGLRSRPNDEARVAFIARTRPRLEALGLTVPPDDCNRKFL
ncbi:MAG: Phenylacetic acid catabolic protein [Sulfurifustaceae bacterium]